VPGIASRETARRLLAGTVAGSLAALGLAAAAAALGPGTPVNRAVLAGVLFPALWLIATLRALLGPAPRRTTTELLVCGAAAAAAAWFSLPA